MEKKIELENNENLYSVDEEEKDSDIKEEKPSEIDSNDDSTEKPCEK